MGDEDKGSFYDQATAKPEGSITPAPLTVVGDPFAGAGAQAEANLAADAAAAAAKESGQPADSPTVKPEGADTNAVVKGQEAPVTPAGEKKGAEASEADPSAVKPEEGEPLPYDKDPKWLAARAAEKTLNEILEKNKIADIDELNAMLDTGLQLKDIVGDLDAESLKGRLEQAQKMDRTETFWAEQEALHKESEETAEQTVDRVKKENAALKAEFQRKEADRNAMLQNQQVVREYEGTVAKAVETSGLSDSEQAIARNLLGVDNPIDKIDIDDRGKVKTAVVQGIDNFSKFIADIKQAAIDEYAAGKSEITPVPKQTIGKETPAIEKKQGNPNASVEESFAEAGEIMKAALRKMAAEE